MWIFKLFKLKNSGSFTLKITSKESSRMFQLWLAENRLLIHHLLPVKNTIELRVLISKLLTSQTLKIRKKFRKPGFRK